MAFRDRPDSTWLRALARRLNARAWLALLWLVIAPAAWGSSALILDDRAGSVPAWPAVSVLADPSRAWSLDDALARRDAFAPPAGAEGTLGLRRDAVWLRLPIQVAPDSRGTWVFDIAYAVLNRADVWLVTEGAAPRHWVLGNSVPRAERPFGGRTHALPLDLAPGSHAELWLRVETAGAMILPITLNTPAAFLDRSVDEQMLQGLLTGLGLFLVLYSLSQWTGLREPMFWRYALLTGGSVMFSVAQFGLGAQYLWGDNLWFERHMPGLSALVASAGTALFVQAILAGDRPQSGFSRTMHACAALLLAAAAAYALDLIGVHTVSTIVGTLGLAPALLGLPGAFRRWRQGDAVGAYLIVAWVGYFVATGLMVGLIGGRQPATWWMLHVFQIGATLDMLLFLRVLALRMAALHDHARAAAREHDTLRSMAHTDALTGLPNRRGLGTELETRLAAARDDRMLALVVLDLDGFKQVNDAHGHAVGDALLVAVARRLREHVREHDLIARIGGDEFVVVADGLRSVAQAERLGGHLLAAFEAPFEAAGHRCTVGLTAGYVLAPLDGRDARTLMIAADTAMLAGKRAGKRQIRRADLLPVS